MSLSAELKNEKPKNEKQKLFLFGVGQVARNVAETAGDYRLIGTTRDSTKVVDLKKMNIEPLLISAESNSESQEDLAPLLAQANVLVTFPPDGFSDKFYSSLCTNSRAIIYISSTSVYGNHQGLVDETTPPDWQNARSKTRLEAEQYWLDRGAIILRAPGLYDFKSGIHLRLKNGTYKLPPQKDNYISRIHLHDLARIIIKAFAKPLDPGSIYVVGDLKPATQIEVVQWLCDRLGRPLPEQASPEQVPVSLTANRQIVSKKILKELALDLHFPTYKEGYGECLTRAGMLNA